MKFWENRRLSLCLMIVAILVATLFGSHRSLAKLRKDAVAVFYSGATAKNGEKEKSLQEDLNDIVTRTSSLIGIAKKYVRDTDVKLADEVSALNDALSSATDIDEKYQAMIALKAKVDTLYYALDGYELSDTNRKSVSIVYYDIQSFYETTGHNSYNEYADQFNQILDKFPASLLAKLTFVDKAPAFR